MQVKGKNVRVIISERVHLVLEASLSLEIRMIALARRCDFARTDR